MDFALPQSLGFMFSAGEVVPSQYMIMGSLVDDLKYSRIAGRGSHSRFRSRFAARARDGHGLLPRARANSLIFNQNLKRKFSRKQTLFGDQNCLCRT